MGFGLFGKVPQKRDFLSVSLPNQVLHPFETWLQSAVTASRADIGRVWEQYYLVAPIWHFWIGPSVIAPGVAGALMPSVDQVGRYFPLAILYWAESGEPIPPPLIAPMDAWYGAIDQRLLGALSQETDGYLGSIFQGLVPPFPDAPPPEREPEIEPVEVVPEPEPEPSAEIGRPDLTVIAPRPLPESEAPYPDPFGITAPPPVLRPADEARSVEPRPAAITPVEHVVDNKGVRTLSLAPRQSVGGNAAALRDLDYEHATAGRSYFWCAASPGGPAQLIAASGLPDPYVFSKMLLWPGKG
jgi:type VI secretion system ImpM family protein